MPVKENFNRTNHVLTSAAVDALDQCLTACSSQPTADIQISTLSRGEQSREKIFITAEAKGRIPVSSFDISLICLMMSDS
eukprot:765359-Hanusia_phi.AAC.4